MAIKGMSRRMAAGDFALTERALTQRIRTIRDNYTRQRDEDLTVYGRYVSCMKRELYALGRRLLMHDQENLAVSALVQSGRRRSSLPCLENNVYHHLIKLIGDGQYPLARSEEDRIACELEYARKHRVPDDYLIGFILQSGADDQTVEEKFRNDREERWFIYARAERTFNAWYHENLLTAYRD